MSASLAAGLAGSLALGSAAAPAMAVSADRRWLSPVSPMHLERRFDPPAHDWLSGHRGVDLAAHLGQEVRAAGTGRVTFAADLAGRGVVVVDHGALRTTYQPVQATVDVGEEVRVGEPIGVIAAGSGHCGSGSCLHLGLRRGETYLDPLLLLVGGIAVLRPL